MSVSAVPPLPESAGEGSEELKQARHEAVTALVLADQAERTARNHRRHATKLLRVYERLLMEFNGQLTIPDS